jgi:hypothetical protein
MKKIYHYIILGFTILFFLGWMLNCTGLVAPDTIPKIPVSTAENITTSDWIKTNQWVSTSVFGLPARAAEVKSDHLNISNLEQNQLYVYANINGQIHPLPYTINTGDSELRFDYTTPQSNSLRIVMISLRGKLQPVEDQQFRYVLIPNNLVNKLPVDMGSYKEVKLHFNLTE